MIRVLGILAGSALAAGALVLLVGLPEFAHRTVFTGDGDGSVITLPMKPPVIEEAESDTEPPRVPIEELPLPAAPKMRIAEPVPRWHSFWSPFKSELAASGFVTQLERVTGLDYRVVKVKTGVYEVAFAYSEDTEIPVHMAQIAAATGLDLPDR